MLIKNLGIRWVRNKAKLTKHNDAIVKCMRQHIHILCLYLSRHSTALCHSLQSVLLLLWCSNIKNWRFLEYRLQAQFPVFLWLILTFMSRRQLCVFEKMVRKYSNFHINFSWIEKLLSLFTLKQHSSPFLSLFQLRKFFILPITLCTVHSAIQ